MKEFYGFFQRLKFKDEKEVDGFFFTALSEEKKPTAHMLVAALIMINTC